jgi:uncharacterized protein YqhQ
LNPENHNTQLTSSPVDRKELGTELAMGGQAVIEGVLMRSPHCVAVAIRKPDGNIVTQQYPFTSRAKRIPFWKLPILRGVISIYEALTIGLKALTWSAEMTEKSEDQESAPPTFWEKIGAGAMMVVALIIGLALFMGIPYILSQWMQHGSTNQFRFHLVAGTTRILIFLLYVWGISRIKDIGRVFQYHGAEHKSIFAFEQGKGMDATSAKEQSRFHPRCGTSFLLIALIAVLIVYAIIDSIVVAIFGNYPNAWWRLLVHLPFIPLVVGISFEALKASGKHFSKPWIRVLIQPGLWLQRITTQEPDESQLEVALTALRLAMHENCQPLPNKEISEKPLLELH